ncbi:hypothetical protein GCM10023321_85230 [Pseudonocardia eucalypti]|uniref:DUF4386 domain-containing protein n=1 Tax=Pseudonocardia eucalypti TaxID=648755 RepID=A0ABP9RF79_9PSEU|nr:hypothetical protein [Pseudonocardia eucalypti]
MTVRYQRICAWAGPFCAFLWIIALLVFAGFLPPHDPQAGADEIARIYADNPLGIRIGLVILLIGGVLYQPWVAVIAVQMKRIEGRQSPLTYVQLGLGTLFVLLFVLAAIFWEVAAFRPLEAPVLTQRFNDLGWFMFLVSVPIITVQGLALSLVVFQDRDGALFPRWFAWFNIWAQIIFLPGTLIPLFKSGPLAWNGLFAFWIPAGVYTVWMCLLTALLLRAIAAPDPVNMRPDGQLR